MLLIFQQWLKMIMIWLVEGLENEANIVAVHNFIYLSSEGHVVLLDGRHQCPHKLKDSLQSQ